MKKIMMTKSLLASVVAMSLTATAVQAKVSAEEAARLGNDLTPLGGEMAGNAAGTIPAYTGGLTTAIEGWKAPKGHRPDPYAADKPQYTVTAANQAEYADILPEAAKAMFAAYPEKFKMNVYPTRRSFANPEWVYANAKSNATTAVMDGNAVSNAWGGTPFPIPQNGLEVILNHELRYMGEQKNWEMTEVVQYPNGKRSEWEVDIQVRTPYNAQTPSAEAKEEGRFFYYNSQVLSPARDSGEGVLTHDYLNPTKSARKAWTYDPGERRVRRAPAINFDGPDRGPNVIDDYDMFSGSPERYDWKLVGKKEMLVPYNNNQMNSPAYTSLDDLFQPEVVNPEKLRYELHRVWIVEADLKEGQRHLYAKRTFYVDEDSWTILATDKFDANGSLWRTGFMYAVTAPDAQVTTWGTYVHYDLKTKAYYALGNAVGRKNGIEFAEEALKTSFYTPQALRRRGR